MIKLCVILKTNYDEQCKVDHLQQLGMQEFQVVVNKMNHH